MKYKHILENWKRFILEARARIHGPDAQERAIKILGLLPSENYTKQEIKKAYRKAVFANHPDYNPGAVDDELIKDINSAYHDALEGGTIDYKASGRRPGAEPAASSTTDAVDYRAIYKALTDTEKAMKEVMRASLSLSRNKTREIIKVSRIMIGRLRILISRLDLISRNLETMGATNIKRDIDLILDKLKVFQEDASEWQNTRYRGPVPSRFAALLRKPTTEDEKHVYRDAWRLIRKMIGKLDRLAKKTGRNFED